MRVDGDFYVTVDNYGNAEYSICAPTLDYWDHPCYFGDATLDHELEFHQDWQGDGMYTQDFYWYECRNCGECIPAGASDAPNFDDDF